MLLAAALACACETTPTLDVQPAPTTGSAGECATCHMAEFQSARHHEGEKPTTCAVCHSQSGWHPMAKRRHNFPLTGAHAKASCFYCHKGQPRVFLGTPHECYGCHRADYEKAPHHVEKHFRRRARSATPRPRGSRCYRAPRQPRPSPRPWRRARRDCPKSRRRGPPRSRARRHVRPRQPRPTATAWPTATPTPTPAPTPRPAPTPTPRPPDVTSGASSRR